MDSDWYIERIGEIVGLSLHEGFKFSIMERIDYTIDTRRRMPGFAFFPV